MLRLDINLVFTVINLLVLYFFMRKFLFGRVNKILEERKRSSRSSLPMPRPPRTRQTA